MVKAVVLFEGTLLAAAAATLYTGPAGSGSTVTRISKITVTNTSPSVPHTFSVSIGLFATPANIVIDARPLAPLETQDIPELVGQIISASQPLQVFADTATIVAARGSGVQIT